MPQSGISGDTSRVESRELATHICVARDVSVTVTKSNRTGVMKSNLARRAAAAGTGTQEPGRTRKVQRKVRGWASRCPHKVKGIRIERC